MQSQADPKKTWKREAAFLVMSLFWYVVLSGGSIELVKVLVWPVFTLFGLAFGLDWFGKSNGVFGNKSPEASGRG